MAIRSLKKPWKTCIMTKFINRPQNSFYIQVNLPFNFIFPQTFPSLLINIPLLYLFLVSLGRAQLLSPVHTQTQGHSSKKSVMHCATFTSGNKITSPSAESCAYSMYQILNEQSTTDQILPL